MQTAPDITCAEVVELVTDYLEGRLSPDDAARFEAHLDLCEGCRNYLEQTRLTIAATHRLREDDLPPELRERFLAAFRTFRR